MKNIIGLLDFLIQLKFLNKRIHFKEPQLLFHPPVLSEGPDLSPFYGVRWETSRGSTERNTAQWFTLEQRPAHFFSVKVQIVFSALQSHMVSDTTAPFCHCSTKIL